MPSSNPDVNTPRTPPSQPASPPLPNMQGQGSPPDLRRLTSQTNLTAGPAPHKQTSLSPRSSIHLGRGPRTSAYAPDASIPSSPTSIHSTSSAIFERDVEPLPLPSLTPATSPHGAASAVGSPVQPAFDKATNPHLIPRGKGTEQLEQSVPSVLDQAATLLANASPDDEDQIAVVSPVAGGSASASILGGDYSILTGSPVRSRSPSPMGLRVGQRQSLLLNLPTPPSTTPGSPSVPPAQAGSPQFRPPLNTQQTMTPSMSRTYSQQSGTSAYYSADGDAEEAHESSPDTTTVENAPTLPTPMPHQTAFATGAPTVGTRRSRSPQRRSSTILSVSSTAGSPTHLGGMVPPSPNPSTTATINKRLSFMSYNDLLTSAPASTVALSQLTAGATSEPPPHLPSVMNAIAVGAGAGSEYGAGTSSAASSVHRLSGVIPIGAHMHGHGFGERSHAAMGKRESALLDDVGGEWEREGMGMSLEDRVEAVIGTSPTLGAGPASHVVNAKA